MGLDLFFQKGLWSSADMLVYHFTILDKQDSRYTGDAIIHGNFRIMVHIHLADFYFTRIFFG